MRTMIFGAVAGLVLSAATLIAPASAAPIPTAAGALATSDAGIVQVQMMHRDRMMHRRMMRHDRHMMHRMMRHDRRMMHRRRMMNRM